MRLPAFETLCDAISDDRLVIVTGSGVSLDLRCAADPTKSLPNWTDLLHHIRNAHQSTLSVNRLDEVDQLIAAGKVSAEYLIEAAEILREEIGEPQFRQTVVQATTPVDKTTTNTHRALEKLSPRGFVTFNYDQGHENVKSGRRLVRMTYADRAKLTEVVAGDFSTPFILKAHGCVSRPGTIVLDRSSYRRVLGEKRAYRAFLEHIFSRFNTLIVGFGMKDPDFEDLMRTLELTHGGAVRDHIYIYRKDRGRLGRAHEIMLQRRFGLIPIGLSDFKQLPVLLRDASSRPGPELRSVVERALIVTGRRAASHRTRRSAHQQLRNLNPIGQRLATAEFRSVAEKTRVNADRRAEAAYSLAHIPTMPESTAEFLFDLIKQGLHPEIVVHAAIALQRYGPANLAKWVVKAKSLLPLCDQADQAILRARNRGQPRARLYLESAIAKWEATQASGDRRRR